ncbi:hypothetical protein BH23ACT3_BH23ACT3_04920 [soil metagenome]
MLIAEAMAAGWEIEAEFVTRGTDPVSSAPAHVLAAGVIERVATTETPQGSLAVVTLPDRRVDLASLSFVLVLDRLADPGNLGTLLRSAEAAGVDAVVLTPGSVDPFNPKVIRASAGAVFHVPTLTAALAEVAAAGLRLVGTSSHLGSAYQRFDWSGRVAVVLGNEAHGLADDAPVEWVTIEHRGRAESLNLARAGTRLVFEASRHR